MYIFETDKIVNRLNEELGSLSGSNKKKIIKSFFGVMLELKDMYKDSEEYYVFESQHKEYLEEIVNHE